MLKIGIIGVGKLGKIHINCLKNIDKYSIKGFFDTNIENSKEVENSTNVKYYNDFNELIDVVDVIDVVTPTPFHFYYAKQSLKKNKHVFIEKPVTNDLRELKELINIYKANPKIKIQVGHVERFNPAFIAAKPYINSPIFIDVNRLSPFSFRANDVSVIKDLMIHDIDIICDIINSKISRISACSASVFTQYDDIANVRMEFDNNAIANLNVSRISLGRFREFKIFQNDSYISIDFLNNKTKLFKVSKHKDSLGEELKDLFPRFTNHKGEEKKILVNDIKVDESNAIKNELESFADAIINDTPEEVTLNQAMDSFIIIDKIMSQLEYKGKYDIKK